MKKIIFTLILAILSIVSYGQSYWTFEDEHSLKGGNIEEIYSLNLKMRDNETQTWNLAAFSTDNGKTFAEDKAMALQWTNNPDTGILRIVIYNIVDGENVELGTYEFKKVRLERIYNRDAATYTYRIMSDSFKSPLIEAVNNKGTGYIKVNQKNLELYFRSKSYIQSRKID